MSIHRRDRRYRCIKGKEIVSAVVKRGVRKPSLDRLINIQEIGVLVQRVGVGNCIVGIFVDIAWAIFGHGAERGSCARSSGEPDGQRSMPWLVP